MLYVRLLQNTFADICQHYVSVTYSGWQLKNEYEHRSWFSPEVQVYLVVQMVNSILLHTQHLSHQSPVYQGSTKAATDNT